MTIQISNRRARILLADDHRIVTEGLHALLEPEFEIVGTVTDGRSLIVAVDRLHPDVTILDISMPMLNGLEAARQILKKAPRAKLIILTMYSDAQYLRESFRAGVSGYLLKNSLSAELVTTVREVLLGRVYLSPSIAEPTLRAFSESGVDGHRNSELTPRQREVLQLVCEGHSSKQIGHILHVSVKTVSFHKHRIKEQLGVQTTAELVKCAVREKIVELQ